MSLLNAEDIDNAIAAAYARGHVAGMLQMEQIEEAGATDQAKVKQIAKMFLAVVTPLTATIPGARVVVSAVSALVDEL